LLLILRRSSDNYEKHRTLMIDGCQSTKRKNQMKINPLLRTLCCIVALIATAVGATVLTWQLNILSVVFRATVTALPEMSALFPVVGLIAAVSFTQILRRRRGAQKTASIG
jgi:hypothetical protein